MPERRRHQMPPVPSLCTTGLKRTCPDSEEAGTVVSGPQGLWKGSANHSSQPSRLSPFTHFLYF